MNRVYIFPRYSGTKNSDWYQQLKQLSCIPEEHIEIIPLSLPNWDKPTCTEFLSNIKEIIPENEIDFNTYFVGHSVGCNAALLFLNDLHHKKPKLKIGGLMCVAGWWKVDNPWPQLNQWTTMPLDFNGIQYICSNNIRCILSDNDPYTSDWSANKTEWEANLNANVLIVPDAKHFNGSEGFSEIKNEFTSFIKSINLL